MKPKAFYYEKIANAMPIMQTMMIDVARHLNDFYLDPNSWVCQEKSDQSPVTTADHFAHHFLCNALAQLGFDIPVISEENSTQEMQAFCQNPPPVYWLIDPLDGTSGFVKGTGHFAVNVAIVYQKQPIAGWIAWPRTGQLCWAYGHESYRSGTCEFAVQKPENLDHLLALRQTVKGPIVYSSTNQAKKKQQVIATLSLLGDDVHVESLGAAIKFCTMFNRLGDMYPRLAGTCLWDLAAGQVLLRARGGEIFRLDGTAMDYCIQTSILNTHFLAVANKNLPQLAMLLRKLSTLSASFSQKAVDKL